MLFLAQRIPLLARGFQLRQEQFKHRGRAAHRRHGTAQLVDVWTVGGGVWHEQYFTKYCRHQPHTSDRKPNDHAAFHGFFRLRPESVDGCAVDAASRCLRVASTAERASDAPHRIQHWATRNGPPPGAWQTDTCRRHSTRGPSGGRNGPVCTVLTAVT